MRKVAVLFLTISMLGTGAMLAQGPKPVVFTHAVIIDGNGGAPIENGVLVVRGDRIESLGPAERSSRANTRISW